MSHPFQEEWGDRDKSPFPKRGGGTVINHPFQRGGPREEGGSTNHI